MKSKNNLLPKYKALFLNETFILILVLLNAICLFWQCYPNSPSILVHFDSLFTILFIVEARIKISEWGFKKYWNSNWNRLDFIVLIISSPSLVQLFIPDVTISSLSFILIFRALRIFRTFKSLRIFRFFPVFQSVASGIRQALKASYLIIFAFLVFLFITSIITCTVFKDLAPEYFSTPMESIYSMFKLYTIEGWYDIPDSISASIHLPLYRGLVKLYFVALLFLGGILGMSLINSILVDSMVSDNNNELIQKVDNLEKKIDDLTKMLGEAQDKEASKNTDE